MNGTKYWPVVIIVAAVALVGVIALVGGFSAISANEEDELFVYSFTGTHELFEIPNGIVVITDDMEVFDGGDLYLIQPEAFSDIVFYSARFYQIIDGEKRTILFNGVEDMTGGTLNIEGDLGRISSADVIRYVLEENLWFELKTTDMSGKENTYQIPLTLEKIVG